ncbi:FlxA-like family protein, partial [Escherichia coli]|uniref:FlxA-like family protein n=1 Tax=Escherichia coli TaxID=562 RepID=UPI00201A6B15
MSVTIQGNTSTVISNNSAPEGTSEIAKITRQIQVLTEKLGKISSEEGMTTQQKKEMAALVQKQIESLRAQLEQLLRLNRPGFPGEYFICELRLPDHRFRWK